jgi:NADH-quinone oxidoreductase subunit K
MIDPLMPQLLAAALFALGLAVSVTRRNLFFVLMGVELMLNAVNLSLVAFSRLLPGDGGVEGQVAALFVIAIAAAEACVGLAMVICLARGRDSLDVDAYASMKE